jgi:hypothetical protein
LSSSSTAIRRDNLKRDGTLSALPFALRLGASINETVANTGLSRSKLYLLIKAGKIEIRKVGARTIVLVPSVVKLLGAEEIVRVLEAEEKAFASELTPMRCTHKRRGPDRPSESTRPGLKVALPVDHSGLADAPSRSSTQGVPLNLEEAEEAARTEGLL